MLALRLRNAAAVAGSLALTKSVGLNEEESLQIATENITSRQSIVPGNNCTSQLTTDV